MENILSLTTMPLMAARTSAPAVGAAELTPKINFGVYDPDNIAYVWSPAGDRDLARYWPGEQYVDCVGLSVLEFAGSDRGYYHQTTRSFHDQMTEKYTRVTRYKKPVVITECGVTGSEEYQLSWLSGALQDLGHYPLLKALIYFNAEEVAGVSASGETAHAI